MSKILITLSSLVIGAGAAVMTSHQTPHKGASGTNAQNTGRNTASSGTNTSNSGQPASSSTTPTTWPTLPAGWHWISLSLHKGPITRVWAPIPGTWYNKPQYTQTGPSRDLVVWGNHVITAQGARFGYGIMMTTKNGTPSQIAQGPLAHNGDMSNPATPFVSTTLAGGQSALITASNHYDPVSGNTGFTLLVPDGSSSSVWITLRVPQGQSSLIPVIRNDLRFVR